MLCYVMVKQIFVKYITIQSYLLEMSLFRIKCVAVVITLRQSWEPSSSQWPTPESISYLCHFPLTLLTKNCRPLVCCGFTKKELQSWPVGIMWVFMITIQNVLLVKYKKIIYNKNICHHITINFSLRNLQVILFLLVFC